ATGISLAGVYCWGSLAAYKIYATEFFGSGLGLTGLLVPQTAGSSSTGAIQYNGLTSSAGMFDGGVTNPSATNRLNYDGSLYVTNLTVEGTLNVVPSGSLVMFAGSTAPNGWLICDGSSLVVASYSALFAAIGYTYGGSGSTFNIPDMREASAVGLGTRSGGVTTHDTFTLGQFKDDQVQNVNHTHTVYINATPHSSDAGTAGVDTSSLGQNVGQLLPGQSMSGPSYTSGTPRMGGNTRGKQHGNCAWCYENRKGKDLIQLREWTRAQIEEIEKN